MYNKNMIRTIVKKWLSLKIKTRFTITLSIYFLILIFLIYLSICYFIKFNYKIIIFDQQRQLLKSIVFHFDENITMIQNYLIKLSSQVPLEKIDNFDFIQSFILHFGKEHVSVDQFFDRGIFIFSKDGRLIGEYPYKTSAYLRDFSNREYFIYTSKYLKPYISQPFMGTREPPKPIILFTVPLIDTNNTFKGIFVGGLTLENDFLLGRLSQIKIGKNGYLYIFNNEKTIIYHPDKNMLLKKELPVDSDDFFNKLINTSDEHIDITVFKGEKFLTTARKLKTTGWVLASNFPLKEIEKPLQNILKRLFLLTLLISIITLSSIWVLMHFQLKPLEKLTNHILQFEKDIFSVSRLNHYAEDEIGILTKSFNNMITTLQNWAKEITTINEELYNLSTTDSLTKLYNRRHVEHILEKEIERAKRYNSKLSILVIDLDNFKMINDTYGHYIGDEVLLETARILRETTRKCDYIGRLGGEEFLVILPSTSLENAIVVAERIRMRISETSIENQIKFTCSIGIAEYQGESLHDLIIKADKLLYTAKKQGKNRVAY